MRDYGTDKPDLRIPWKLIDCTDELRNILQPSGMDVKFTVKMFIAKHVEDKINKKDIEKWKLNINGLPFHQVIYEVRIF